MEVSERLGESEKERRDGQGQGHWTHARRPLDPLADAVLVHLLLALIDVPDRVEAELEALGLQTPLHPEAPDDLERRWRPRLDKLPARRLARRLRTQPRVHLERLGDLDRRCDAGGERTRAGSR